MEVLVGYKPRSPTRVLLGQKTLKGRKESCTNTRKIVTSGMLGVTVEEETGVAIVDVEPEAAIDNEKACCSEFGEGCWRITTWRLKVTSGRMNAKVIDGGGDDEEQE
jgi:hypothetical protein